jgi:kojibiose phosphorylase
MSKRLWSIKEYPFQPEKLRYYETVMTVGNGYLGTRATFEEGFDGDAPATLIHGIYNHAPEMSVPELVNAPDWTELHLIVDGTPFKLNTASESALKPPQGLTLGYERILHFDRGLLRRVVLFRAATGATVRVTFERFASLSDQHVLAQRVHITAIDGAPEIRVEAVLSGAVTNNGVQHWARIQPAAEGGVISLKGITSQSGYGLAMASTLVSSAAVSTTADDVRASAVAAVKLARDGEVTFDKLTTVYTTRDTPEVLDSAQRKLAQTLAAGYDALLSAHEAAWQRCWEAVDIQIEGDEAAQIGLRFATYHVVIAAPQHDENVSVGAKTLSGLGYKGHVFWDTELFMLPPFTLTIPRIARNMLMYRFNRLDGARRKAKENGFKGAMFPWESTDTGLETTPQWSDPFPPDGHRIRIWTGDNEQHISTDIAYAVIQYWCWTGDNDFMIRHGAELVLDTAVFWASRVEDLNGRYELHDQIGPDEYHENINNSVFVNRMVVWHMQTALDLLAWLEQHAPQDATRLRDQFGLDVPQLAKWRDIIARMYIPFDDELGIHVQFDGFFDMEYIPVPRYEPRVGGIWPFLGHERALQSQVIKQADVVMLMALLGDAVGSREVMHNNWNTYYPRCDHGSSLSPAMHAWVAARLGLKDEAYHMFEHAAAIDLEDNKGNVRDGIHGAASGGLWQAVVFGFCGLHLTPDGPALDPNLPPHWKRVSFNVVYQGKRYSLKAE